MLSSILIFLVVLSLLILVHELGHFLVARHSGVWVEEFGIGLPPRVVGKKVGETIYSVNLLPFGGFVRLHGEGDEEGVTRPTRAFINKSKKVRTAIVTAGVIMNFLLGVFAFATTYSFSGIPQETGNVKVVEVATDSPAQIAGILVEDVVRKVDDIEITTTDQFIEVIEENKGERVTLFLEREIAQGTETKKITLRPREEPPEGEGPLGVTITSIETYFPPLWQRPFFGIYYGFGEALFWGKNVVLGFLSIFSDLLGGQAPKDIAGPVGIFAITSQAASLGALALINFVGILSVNLAILNIIPFPALDGGRLAFLGVEAFFGRRIVPKLESIAHAVGMVILLILVLLITIHDIQRIIEAGGISGFLDNPLR